MNVVYVVGPYRAKTDAERWMNIARARLVAMNLWRQGYAVICPHSNSAWMSGAADEQTFMQGNRVILSRCDAIALVYGWQGSLGSRKEVRLAKELGLQIIDMTHIGCGPTVSSINSEDE